jgi:hypothetical protein
MKKSLLEIYALAVCFIAALVVLTSVVMDADHVLALAAPDLMMDTFTHRQTADNDSYFQMHRGEFNPQTKSFPPRPSEDTLTAKRLAAKTVANSEEQRLALQGLLKDIIVTLVAAGFFVVHWIIAKQQRERTAAAA